MKRLIFSAIFCAITTITFAQTTTTDSLKAATDTTKKRHRMLKFTLKGDRDGVHVRDTTKKAKTSGFTWGITFSRFDLGLTTLVDNGSFRLSPANEFLRYRSWKSSNVGFDVIQFGYRFTPNFKMYVSGGWDWTLIRLRENITILPDQPVLTYRTDNIQYSKNRFSSSYIRVPLTFDFRTNEDADGKRWHFTIGPDMGFLVGGRVKQISSENGKQKIDNDYHFAKVRYGGFTRVAHGSIGIFAKYYFNDMFEDSPAQEGLKNFSFGFTLGI